MPLARFLRLRAAAATGCALFIATSASCKPGSYELKSSGSYNPSIGLYGSFDVYEPTGDSVRTQRPAIVAIHGGAWKGGDKVWGENIAAELCPYGYVVFSINYRLSSNPGGQWPAQITDVQQALRHIRANAERYRIDPARMASLGMSAGGHLATMVALRDDLSGGSGRVNIAVNLDGEHDMTMPPAQVMDDFEGILAKVFGHAAPWSDSELRDISTVTFARPDVSLFTIHGAGDRNVYVNQGERITQVLKAAGAATEFVRIDGKEGDCHEDCWRVSLARRALHRFLGRTLNHDAAAYFEQKTGTKSPLWH